MEAPLGDLEIFRLRNRSFNQLNQILNCDLCLPEEPLPFEERVEHLEKAKNVKELVWNFLDKGHYDEAASILRQRQNTTGLNGLNIALQIVECDIRSDCGNVSVSINRLKDLIQKSCSANDVKIMSDELMRRHHIIVAVILLYIAHKISQQASQALPDDAAQETGDTAFNIADAAVQDTGFKYEESRRLAIRYGLKWTSELLRELRALHGASRDVVAINEARILTSISFLHIHALEHEKAVECGKEGITCLEKNFGEDAVKCNHYGLLLNNIGLALFHSKQYSNADSYCSKALEIFIVTDYDDEEDRQGDINMAETNLKHITYEKKQNIRQGLAE